MNERIGHTVCAQFFHNNIYDNLAIKNVFHDKVK
jgi:hypothetical protein